LQCFGGGVAGDVVGGGGVVDCLIIILDNILYTNLSLVLNNLQQIKQDLNAIFQWVAHLSLMQWILFISIF
jgi:hypothetical protein